MILKLRKDYEAQERANLSAKKFHDELLRHGMPPMPLLREIMLKDNPGGLRCCRNSAAV